MIPDSILWSSIEKASRTHNYTISQLKDKPTTYLEGYVQSHEDSNPLTRFFGWLSNSRNHIRYDVARDLLEDRELEEMFDHQLEAVASQKTGFFTKHREFDRVMKAGRIWSKRKEATIQD
jgi:hypothetical protein